MAVLRNGPFTNGPAANPETWASEVDYTGMGPTDEFAEPSSTSDAPYNDTFGWARGLSALDTARPMPPQDGFHGDGDRWQPYWRLRDADDANRHSVETVEGLPNHDLKSESKNSYQRWALPPNSTPPPVNRPTNLNSPGSYEFTRPFDQDWARQNNGVHFSMADHRRLTEIYGMRPTATARNTYRAEVPPWDQNIVDMPPPATVVNERLAAIELPMGRSYRAS